MSLSLHALHNAQLTVRQLESLQRALPGSLAAQVPFGQDRFASARALTSGQDFFDPRAQDPQLSFDQALSRLLRVMRAFGEAAVEPQPAPASSSVRALAASEPPRVDRARLYQFVFVEPPAAYRAEAAGMNAQKALQADGYDSLAAEVSARRRVLLAA